MNQFEKCKRTWLMIFTALCFGVILTEGTSELLNTQQVTLFSGEYHLWWCWRFMTQISLNHCAGTHDSVKYLHMGQTCIYLLSSCIALASHTQNTYFQLPSVLHNNTCNELSEFLVSLINLFVFFLLKSELQKANSKSFITS